MNVFQGVHFNFDFLMPGLLRYGAFILGFALMGALVTRLLFHWLPWRTYRDLFNIMVGLGGIAGLYVCARWFS